MLRTKKQPAYTIRQTPTPLISLTSDLKHHQTKEWYKQAKIVESRHNGRAYELIDDDGKTYYRGRRFLRAV